MEGGGGIYRLGFVGFVGMPGCTNHAPAPAPALVRQQASLGQQAGGLSATAVKTKNNKNRNRTCVQ